RGSIGVLAHVPVSVGLFSGPRFDSHGLAAQVRGAADLRAPCLHEPLLAGFVVRDEIDGLLTLGRRAEARDAYVVSGADVRADAGEVSVVPAEPDADHRADGIAEVDVPADDLPCVGIDGLVGRVGRVDADLKRTFGLDVRRHLRGDAGLLGGAACRRWRAGR